MAVLVLRFPSCAFYLSTTFYIRHHLSFHGSINDTVANHPLVILINVALKRCRYLRYKRNNHIPPIIFFPLQKNPNIILFLGIPYSFSGLACSLLSRIFWREENEFVTQIPLFLYIPTPCNRSPSLAVGRSAETCVLPPSFIREVINQCFESIWAIYVVYVKARKRSHIDVW